MYPSTLTQLAARANPFSAPLFKLQKAEEPEKHAPEQKRVFAAAAVAGKTADSDHRPYISKTCFKCTFMVEIESRIKINSLTPHTFSVYCFILACTVSTMNKRLA